MQLPDTDCLSSVERIYLKRETPWWPEATLVLQPPPFRTARRVQ